MRELGCDLTTHLSKSLDKMPEIEFDFVAPMGYGDACPFVRAKERADWQLLDPKNLPRSEFNQVRDLIADKVRDALARSL